MGGGSYNNQGDPMAAIGRMLGSGQGPQVGVGRSNRERRHSAGGLG